jgi:methylenetetrahydrofolate dehydrogenase (NADP+)/methenyltetrahydrofolate cyclohydrolase
MRDSAPGARLLDGLDLAARIRQGVSDTVRSHPGLDPKLRVFLIGDNPASAAYVRAKSRAATEAGVLSETVTLPATIRFEELREAILEANADDRVDGILVQLPLPAALPAAGVLDLVDPHKDVDGFHPENVGRLHQGRPRFVPCTPAGVMRLLEDQKIPLSGARAVVLGRSDIVGKPMSALLTAADATVTTCHSKTRGLAALCRDADVLVAAIGRPGFVTAEFVRPGATVVDVGINRVSVSDCPPALRDSPRVASAFANGKSVLVGDVDFDSVQPIAGALTPVPGGVGPLTVAMLLENTVRAAKARRLSV